MAKRDAFAQLTSAWGTMTRMAYGAYIFDLDGTLLDTLPDLVRLTNMVLNEFGWPERTRDEILGFVGNGGRVLLGRAAPAGTPDEELDEAFTRWRALYPVYGHELTEPYKGIPEVLSRMKAAGAKLGVLSNKFDAAAQAVIAEQFPCVFHLVRGECEEIPRKPNPAGLRFMMGQLGVGPNDVLYVGDSATDVETAHRAGVACVAVSWGYQSSGALRAAGATTIIDNPFDLLVQ